MLLIRNAAQLICVSKPSSETCTTADKGHLGIIENGAVVVEDDRVAWVGSTSNLPAFPSSSSTVFDAAGKIVIPGLIDSHTHLIFTGSREEEFEQRLRGSSYQEIASRGGGINATVRHVRQSSKAELKETAGKRLNRLLSYGVTTVEVKSGYGLTLNDEIKCLEVIADLNAEGPWELIPTFLGAHAIPPEFADNRNGYVHLLVDEMLPEIARCRLARFCDVFCEVGAFSLTETETILTKARELGFGLKLHADELSPLGGAELAARMGAASADHLLCITEAGIEAMARSETVATLLPGTAFFLGMNYAPARKLIDRGVRVALASDCNPGTCPTENLPLIGVMACTQMKMLPSEVLTALTRHGAKAVDCPERLGSIEVGKQADLIICDVPDYRQLFYHFGVNHVWRVIKRGRVVYAA
jgi:imidazolonepropionase